MARDHNAADASKAEPGPDEKSLPPGLLRLKQLWGLDQPKKHEVAPAGVRHDIYHVADRRIPRRRRGNRVDH